MKYLIYFFIATLLGCAVSGEHGDRIKTCSREANAYSPGQRIGNSAYWSCLEREEKRQTQQKTDQQQAVYLRQLQNRCDAFGFQRGTTAHSNCMLNQQQQDNLTLQNAQLIQLQQQQQSQQQLNDAVRLLNPPRPAPLTCFNAPGSPYTTCN
jgi:hypothetical protein